MVISALKETVRVGDCRKFKFDSQEAFFFEKVTFEPELNDGVAASPTPGVYPNPCPSSQ